MKSVHRSVLVWHSAPEMFALVTDVARYPEFLPWCDHAAVLEQHDAGMRAEVGLSIAGLRQRFTTLNRHLPDREVSMTLVDGPFSHLDGQWSFHVLGDGTQDACRVELRLSYKFKSATLAAIVGPVFDRIASELVDAFVKRADQVYGST